MATPSLPSTPPSARGGAPAGAVAASVAVSKEGAVPTGWEAIDRLLAVEEASSADDARAAEMPTAARRQGLDRGVLHEWFGLVPTDEASQAHTHGASTTSLRHDWLPPLSMLAHLAGCALAEGARDAGTHARTERVVWIGRSVWPYPPALLGVAACGCASDDDTTASTRAAPLASIVQADRFEAGHIQDEQLATAQPRATCPIHGGALLARSVFIDPPDDKARLRAIDLCVRCPSVAAVVADGRGLRMAHTRRLQLAARRGRALVLLARPPHEVHELSVAATRWLVEQASETCLPGASLPSASASDGSVAAIAPRFGLRLLRRKRPFDAMASSSGASSSAAPPSDRLSSSARLARVRDALPTALRAAGFVADAARASGVRPGSDEGRRWSLEGSDATGAVRLVPDVVDRPVPAARTRRTGARSLVES